MSNEIGDWPLVPNLNSANRTQFDVNSHFLSENIFGFEKILSKLTMLRAPFFFRFESNDFNNSRILMRIVVPLNFCNLQNFFPNTTFAKRGFAKLAKQIRNFMFESLNGVDWNNFYSNEDFVQQLDEMIELAKLIYFINDERFHCGKLKAGHSRVVNVLTINELNEKLNTNFLAFNFIDYVQFLNENADKVKLNASTQVVITSRTLSYLTDLFVGIKKLNYDQEHLRRAFKNLIYFNLLYSLVKPLEIFSTPHLHMSLPIRYYHAYLEYAKIHHRISPFESFKSLYRINQEQNCAYSVIDAFSVVGSVEQVELQRLFLTEKFNSNTKNITVEILDHLLAITVFVISNQDWISSNSKLNIFKSLNEMEHRIVYSDSIFDLSEENKPNLMDSRYKLTSHYIENIFILKKRSYQKEFELLNSRQNERIRNKKYVFDIFLANLMYLKEHNTMLMPAGVLIGTN